MTKLTYADILKVLADGPADQRPGERAWVVGVFEDRPGKYFDAFPPGIVYSIEFEDGSSIEVHEAMLEPAD